MMLLNTSTIKMKEFQGENVPPYAILSHRWEKGEVSYDDLLREIGPSLAGYEKLLGFCRQAKEDGFKYCVR
jgi:hypothetical protein